MSGIMLNWPEGPRQIRLGPGELHVWAVRLDGYSDLELAVARQSLSDLEQTRAERFHRREDRNHYVVQHEALRGLLGKYLDCGPASVEFGQGPNGKPELVDLKTHSLHFNQSRSCGLGLLAFTRQGSVGVDIEKIRSVPEFEDIVRVHYSEYEQESMAHLTAPERLTGFFVAWTLKEAFLKATGEGVTEGMAKVEVELGNLNQRHFHKLPPAWTKEASWFCQEVSPATGWMGSVVVRGNIEVLRGWQLPPHLAIST